MTGFGSSVRLIAGVAIALVLGGASVLAPPGRGAVRGSGEESLTISNSTGKSVKSTTVLEAGHMYKLSVSGEASDWCAPNAKSAADCSNGSPLAIAKGVDALYCYAKWRCPGASELWRPLRVNGLGIDEIAQVAGEIKPSDMHDYDVYITGARGRLTFSAADGSHEDNSGQWDVKLTDLGPTFVEFTFQGHASSGLSVNAMDGRWIGTGTRLTPSPTYKPDIGLHANGHSYTLEGKVATVERQGRLVPRLSIVASLSKSSDPKCAVGSKALVTFDNSPSGGTLRIQLTCGASADQGLTFTRPPVTLGAEVRATGEPSHMPPATATGGANPL